MNDAQTKIAVALSYRPNRDQAPQVVAKGQRLAAERMIALGEATRVPVVANASLAASLEKLDLGAAVSPELYQTVAEVLAFVYRLDDRYARRTDADLSRKR